MQLPLGCRVMSPFTTCCGACFYCERGFTCRCSHAQGARLFGWVDEAEAALPAAQQQGLHGSQAQFVRVPLADSTLMPVPDDVSDASAVLLGDVLSTAFFCAEQGGVGPGCVVAVVGCGPVGLLAVMACQHLGAASVFALDGVPERLQMAQSLGAQPLRCEPPEAALAAVRAATQGRGADVALEVVGAPAALKLAFDLLRPCGVLSSVGVHTAPHFAFSPVDGYNKNNTFKMGRCPARHMMSKLVEVVRARGQDFERIITHRLGLSDGVQAYKMFDEKLDVSCCLALIMLPALLPPVLRCCSQTPTPP